MSMAYAVQQTEAQKHTYGDYLKFPEDGKRWEIIEGVPYMMAAPSRNHQITLSWLFYMVFSHLINKRCQVFPAPFDVRIPLYNEKRDDDVINVVQPDITVYCDESKHDAKGGRGAPDLIIEILSPSSAKMDKYTKFMLYERAGVKEYWLVDPVYETVEIFRLKDGTFIKIGLFDKNDTLPAPEIGCADLEGLEISVAQIFGSKINPNEENKS